MSGEPWSKIDYSIPWKEIKMKTRVVHCKKEKYDVLIDRTTKWGNPFTVAEFGREGALRRYKYWLMHQDNLLESLHELKGKVLGCWCKPKDCHGDILVELVEWADRRDEVIEDQGMGIA